MRGVALVIRAFVEIALGLPRTRLVAFPTKPMPPTNTDKWGGFSPIINQEEKWTREFLDS